MSVVEYARVAACHQRWMILHACLLSAFIFLGFVVTPWAFSSACVFALLAAEHREDRNRALARLHRE